MFSLRCLIALVLSVTLFSQARGDWPTSLGDNARRGSTDENLPTKLQLKWVYSAPARPEMAWGGPRVEPIEGKLMRSRVDYDKSLDVVAVAGRVYFGSSVDHQVRCVDAISGELVWKFFTDGAIRLAPTVWNNKVYVGSDDGFVYCLDAASGKPIWSVHAGPRDERLLARGQMISRWPVRTGVLVDDGVAYFGAGVFPHETVYLMAVDAQTGKVVWKNDRISQEDAGRNPLSPQGTLLCTEEMLFVPSGRSLPAAFDKHTGKQIHHRSHSWRTSAGGVVGGHKALLSDGQIYSSGPHHFLALDQKTGSTGYAWIDGRQLAITGDRGFVANGTRIAGLDRKKHTAATVARQKLNLEQYTLSRKRNQMDRKEYDKQYAEFTKQIKELDDVGTLWTATSSSDSSLIVAGDVVVAGGHGTVSSHSAKTGESLWQAKIEGEASGLAAAGGRLFVSTTYGKIYAFAAPDAAPELKSAAQFPATVTQPVYANDKLTGMYATAAKEILQRTGTPRGFCLVVGSEQGRLAYELARNSDLKIVGVEPDAEKVAASRKALDRAGLYGNRVLIIHADPADMPLANYFANLVVSDTLLLTGNLPTNTGQIARRIKPCGGMICLGGPDTAPGRSDRWMTNKLQPFLASLNIRLETNRVDEDYVTATRGTLPGAGSWSHQYGDVANTSMSKDYRVKGGMGVLWYGDPGPASIINRHEAAAAPLSTYGRMFIQGIESILCYDAYNGTFLWEYKNPGALRTGVFNNEETSNLAASDDALFVAVDDTCTEIDAATGKVRRVHKAPQSDDGVPRVWGYLGYYDGMVLGTSTVRKELERSLRRRGHTVANTTHAIFAIDVASGKQKWIYKGKNILHVTVAVGDGQVFMIDSSISQQQRDSLLREDKSELKNLPPEEAKQKEAELKKLDIRLAVALDAETGQQQWSVPVDVTDCSYVGIGGGQLTLMYQDGHVVICGANANGHYWRQFLSGQFSKRRLLVLEAKTGAKLWAKDANYRHRPIIVVDQIIAEPWSFDLHTGNEKQREHPLTGELAKWQFSRPGHHCGGLTATPNTLFFRSGFTSYYDLYSDSGVSHFSGQRMGCWINAIPGNGLLMVPEASAGCVCQFSIAATVVMEPRTDVDTWKIASLGNVGTPVQHLAINLGAPGDRRDSFGTLWLAYPRPKTVGRLEYTFDIKPKIASGGGVFVYNSESLDVAGADTPWVISSGYRGLASCEVALRGKDDKPAKYTVKLYFAQLDECVPGEMLCDIKLQGALVAEGVDIAAEAGDDRNVLVREFTGVDVTQSLLLEIVSKGKILPQLSAIEIQKE
jgi:outer membrane protein assembly factor BamB